jgi:hypothetical protein
VFIQFAVTTGRHFDVAHFIEQRGNMSDYKSVREERRKQEVAEKKAEQPKK